MDIAMDKKDQAILDLLKKNASLTTGRMASKLNIPITTVHNRIKKLLKVGIIKNFTVNIDYKRLGYDLLTFINVGVTYTLPSGERIKQEDVALAIKRLNVEEVHIVAGGTDIIVKVRAKNVEDLNDFVTKKLRSIKGVDTTQTMIVLQEV